MRMRYFTLALAVVAVVMASHPNERTYPYQQPPTQEKPNVAASPSESNHKEKAENHQRGTDANPPKWYASIERPEWIAIFVGLLTAGIICWQAIEMRRATQVMRDTIELQEFQMQQWVEIEGWEIEGDSPYDDTGYLKTALTVRYKFWILNNTDIPLTIKKVITMIGRIGTTLEVFEAIEETVIPPCKGDIKRGHPCHVPIKMSSKEITDYVSDIATVMSVRVTVSFLEARRTKSQFFGHIANFSYGKLSHYEFIGTEPSRKEIRYR